MGLLDLFLLTQNLHVSSLDFVEGGCVCVCVCVCACVCVCVRTCMGVVFVCVSMDTGKQWAMVVPVRLDHAILIAVCIYTALLVSPEFCLCDSQRV